MRLCVEADGSAPFHNSRHHQKGQRWRRRATVHTLKAFDSLRETPTDGRLEASWSLHGSLEALIVNKQTNKKKETNARLEAPTRPVGEKNLWLLDSFQRERK